MIISSYRVTGRKTEDTPPAHAIEAEGTNGTTLWVYRPDGSDAVTFTVLGKQGGYLGTVEITPEAVSALVQELVGREMHLTVAMQEHLRADKGQSGG